ncbi:MAG: hypothetical protein JSW72_09360 [Candidatus Bathyarchaeota archaeon]|nr:MAG: hypothetical protein JSW72_09360 [Candidatus Bathyarchaeota archaeon]
MFNNSTTPKGVVADVSKLISTFSIVCLIAMLSLTNSGMFVKGQPSVITVPDDYVKIQEAINNAFDGDTIFIRAGTYNEHVVVNKSLSLIGEADAAIIDGNGTGNVVVVTANNVSIIDLTIQNSGSSFSDYGILLYADNNLVSSNVITNNYYGIGVLVSKANVVAGNNIFSNNYGVKLFLAVNNTFHHNNFDNLYPAESDEFSSTFWDDGAEGNYWSGYTGVDQNADGIGESPHPIPPFNQDIFPLMGQFSSFDAVSQDATYHVTTISNSTVSEFRFEVGLETGNKIIGLNVTGEDGVAGFLRIMLPTELMSSPYIALYGLEEIGPKQLFSNQTHVTLYLTYVHDSRIITLISSKFQDLYQSLNATYNQLLANYISLNTTYHSLLSLCENLNITYNELLDNYSSLNTTFYELLNSYSLVLENYTLLQTSYSELNSSYQQHLADYNNSLLNIANLTNLYYNLLNTNAVIQMNMFNLNRSYSELVNSYTLLLNNHSQLKTDYDELNGSYQEHLSNFSDNVMGIQNLTYVFAATTAIFIMTTIYLSKHAHKNNTTVESQ